MIVGVVEVGARGADRHRAVEVHGHVGDRARLAQVPQREQHRLRPAHRERRDEHDAVARDGAAHDLADRLDRVHGRVTSIAVGGLEHESVGGERARRWAHHEIVRAAQVAGEQHRRAVGRETHDRCAEDVPRRRVLHREAGPELELHARGHRCEQLQRGLGFRFRVERTRRAVLRVAAPLGV